MTRKQKSRETVSSSVSGYVLNEVLKTMNIQGTSKDYYKRNESEERLKYEDICEEPKVTNKTLFMWSDLEALEYSNHY